MGNTNCKNVTQALTFCRCVLLHQALTVVNSPPNVDADWERNIGALIANDEDARNSLNEYFRTYLTVSSENQEAPKALKIYLQASYIGMISSGGGDSNRGGDFLLELCPLLPNAAYIGLSANISSLQGSVFSTKKKLRETASHVFGLLARYVILDCFFPIRTFGLGHETSSGSCTKVSP